MRIESLHDALNYFPDASGLWNSDDLSTTEMQIESMLQQTKKVEWRLKLARVQALQNKMTEARESLEEVQRMLAAASGGEPGANPVAELRLLLENGRYLALSGSVARANDVFAKAWLLAGETSETYMAIDAALMLSFTRPQKAQYEWLQKAMELASSTQDEEARMWLVQLLVLDGWISFDARSYEKALTSFERALLQPSVLKDERKGFRILWSKGKTLRALGHVQEALAIHDSLRISMQKLGKVSGYVYLEIAECQQLLKLTDDAKANFELAHTELSLEPWYADNRADELSRMKYLYKKR